MFAQMDFCTTDLGTIEFYSMGHREEEETRPENTIKCLSIASRK